MRNTVWFLFLLVSSTRVFSQDKILLNVAPSKIRMDVKMLIPYDNAYILESYHNFRHNFWFIYTDTLRPGENGMLIGKKGFTDPKDFVNEVNICDPAVNVVRNSITADQAKQRMEGLNSSYSGVDVESFRKSALTTLQEHTSSVCYDDFLLMVKNFEDQQVGLEKAVERKKAELLEKFKIEPSLADAIFIRRFLREMQTEQIDVLTLEWVIRNKPDDFLLACELDPQYRNFKNLLPLLTEITDTRSLAEILRRTDLKTPRKKNIISKLLK